MNHVLRKTKNRVIHKLIIIIFNQTHHLHLLIGSSLTAFTNNLKYTDYRSKKLNATCRRQ